MLAMASEQTPQNHKKGIHMSLHLIIGDKDLSSWSLRGALALALTGAVGLCANAQRFFLHPQQHAV